MGVVYEATQLSLERKVALKVVAPHLSDDPEFGERFRREGLAQAQVGHPNIVPVHEAGESDAGLFLAMGLVHGTNLKQLIVDDRLDLRRTLYLLAQIADALDAAHSLGMVHRDVKPQNILVNHEYSAYLADFGLTKALGAKSLTKTGRVLGSLDYIAPEQIRGEPPTGRSDIYALGAVLYECLTKEAPYPRDTDAALLYAHMAEPPPSLRERRPDLPVELEQVVATAMAKDASERYATATAMIHAAEDATGVVVERPTPAALLPAPTQGGGPSGLRRESTTQPKDAVAALRRRVSRGSAAILAAAGLLAAVVVAGWLVGNSGSATVVTRGQEIAAGPVRVSAPPGWTAGAARLSLAGLPLAGATAVGPPDARGVALAAGMTHAAAPRFLPDSFEARIGHARGRLVRLGRFEALRYRTPALVLYAIPTEFGTATIVCVRGGVQCARGAATLRLVGASAYSPRLGRRYAVAIAAVVGRLARARARGVAGLRGARRPEGQVGPAWALAAAFRAAARSIHAVRTPRVGRAASRRLASDLRRTAAAYTRLAAAAKAARPRDYDAARRAAAAAERSAQRDLAVLSELV